MQGSRAELGVNGIRVETYGEPSSRPPLLFVHGGCQGSWAWHKIAPELASDGWYSVCLNWFGHNGSATLHPGLALKRSILDVTAEIAEVADFLGKVPVVIGHSMGGLASLTFATIRPVAALVLLVPVVPAGFAADPISLEVDPNAMWIPPAQMMDHAWWGEASAEEAQHYSSLVCPESPQAVMEATRWLCEVETRQLRVPALVFAAENDVLVPPQAVNALAKAIEADFVELRNTGHGVPLNPVWAQVTTQINEWLEMNCT
ncbi:alpha/beta fold hydrolase [Mycobacterium sp. UM_CSW]|uniref:alpha/beta hydrolase n=1 Tax=Mycobacterium sp. UM_CSW TaxID=1370119 RepID=UPI0009DC0964|nr:alpha/beta fold hydrolase [Mycobacterium sp. UM_CSW]